MASPLKPSTVQEIHRLAESGMTPREISRALRIGHVAARGHWREWQAAQGEDAPAGTPEPLAATPEPERKPDPKTRRTYREDGDSAELTYPTEHEVQTLEDALAYAAVDADVWRVTSWECTSWEMVAKREEIVLRGGREMKLKTPERHHLWRVHLKLERIKSDPAADAADALYRRLESRSPCYVLAPAIRIEPPPYFMDIDLFDAHFGNLAWAPECRENDDLKIKEAIFANAIDDLLAKTQGYPISEILFPLGNDLHHVDTLSRTTTAGTPQDCDGRYAKMIEVTEWAAIAAIERMLASPTVREIHVIYVPGNHDTLSTLHLCRTVAAWFRNCDRVSVDTSPTPRKYVERGCCLFGYTHGENMNDGKLKSLPTIMAVEEPARWGRTTCREWKLGHKHTSQSYETMSSNEINGVMMRRLSALTGTNSWHHKEGYVGNTRAAEAYLYSRDSGFEGMFVARARS